MQQIPLSQGKTALVDDDLFALLSETKWCYRGERNGAQGYAVRHAMIDGKDRLLYLHRVVMPAPKGCETIFRNHDRLDCRRENLRVVTKKEARQHHRVRSDSKTGAKGVRYNPEGGTWSAQIYRNGRCYTIATHYTKEAAIAAYEHAVRSENQDLHRSPAKVDRQDLLNAIPQGPGVA